MQLHASIVSNCITIAANLEAGRRYPRTGMSPKCRLAVLAEVDRKNALAGASSFGRRRRGRGGFQCLVERLAGRRADGLGLAEDLAGAQLRSARGACRT